MKCLSCDVILDDFEATRKYADSKKFVDLCNKCFHTIEAETPVLEREDLRHVEDNTLEDYSYEESSI